MKTLTTIHIKYISAGKIEKQAVSLECTIASYTVISLLALEQITLDEAVYIGNLECNYTDKQSLKKNPL